MKPLIAVLIAILIIPSVFAIDCNKLNNNGLCEEIKNSNITNEEKEYLLSDIIGDLKNFPSHEFVKQWNLNIDTSKSPDNTQKYSEGYIKNAWVKLLAIMPSVLEDNKLYHSDTGEVLSAFNHEVEIPAETISGDCKTEYILKENKGILNIFLNNRYVSSGRLASFTTFEDTNFRAEYDITLKTDIKHYKTEKYCCVWKKGKCKQWCEKCEYKYTEQKTDNLKISDNLDGKYYSPETTANFTVIDKYADATKGILSGTNFTSLHLSFLNSYLSEYNYFYNVIWSIPPYDVLAVKADKQKRIEHQNIFFEENNGYNVEVKDTTNCEITVYNHFKNETLPCNLDFQDLDIQFVTDKLIYSPGEIIRLNINPIGYNFNITYANETYLANEYLNLMAVYPYNKISLVYNGRSYDKIIHVKNEEPLNVLLSLSVFGMGNYALIGLIRKYWGMAL